MTAAYIKIAVEVDFTVKGLVTVKFEDNTTHTFKINDYRQAIVNPDFPGHFATTETTRFLTDPNMLSLSDLSKLDDAGINEENSDTEYVELPLPEIDSEEVTSVSYDYRPTVVFVAGIVAFAYMFSISPVYTICLAVLLVLYRLLV